MAGITISVEDLLGTIAGADKAALDAGVIDPDAVWYVWRTQQDDRVRPAHQALDGTVWRVGDPAAPIPPSSYGCRCYVEYVAPPDSPMRGQIPPAPTAEEPRPVAVHYADFLNGEVEDWRSIYANSKSYASADRLNQITHTLKERGISTPSDYAVMILDAGTHHGR